MTPSVFRAVATCVVPEAGRLDAAQWDEMTAIVARAIAARPRGMQRQLALFFTLLGATFLIFRKAGPERALALGLMVSQRNMGLMLAATEGVLPGTTWLYFAMSQFPIYLSPQLLKPLADRLRTTASSG